MHGSRFKPASGHALAMPQLTWKMLPMIVCLEKQPFELHHEVWYDRRHGSSISNNMQLTAQKRLHLQDDISEGSHTLSTAKKLALLSAFAAFWGAPFFVLQPTRQHQNKRSREAASPFEGARRVRSRADPEHESVQSFSRVPAEYQAVTVAFNSIQQDGPATHQAVPTSWSRGSANQQHPIPNARGAEQSAWGCANGTHPSLSLNALSVVAAHLVHLEICGQPGLKDLSALKGMSSRPAVDLMALHAQCTLSMVSTVEAVHCPPMPFPGEYTHTHTHTHTHRERERERERERGRARVSLLSSSFSCFC